MEHLSARSSDDPRAALAAAGDFLRARPVENNLVLTLLAQRVASPQDGRYWWAVRGTEVVGFALQSPRSFRAVLSCAWDAAVGDALVDLMVDEAPDLPGVTSEAAIAAAFAGRWAERRRVPATPSEGMRIYRLGELRPPRGVPGLFRQGRPSDRDVLVGWATHFMEATGSPPFDPAEMIDRHLGHGRLWLWERDRRPVSVAAATVPVVGVSRVGLVYTPPEHRSQGYAAACVAALSAWALAGDADTCILYTQLSNPTSNGVYRRIGYDPVMEALVYRFG